MEERPNNLADRTSKLGPVTLVGSHVRLEPLEKRHAKALLEAAMGLDFAWMSSKLVDLDAIEKWIDSSLESQARGEEYPFVVRLKSSNEIIGSTRYMDTHEAHRTTEIGWSWYAKRVWGTVVNPECKLLLLGHAFEDWGAIRVQLKTDNNNLRSQRAILKLGAKFEGRLRNHRIRPDGTIRDTMMYSITKEEWPEVRSGLTRRIEQGGIE